MIAQVGRFLSELSVETSTLNVRCSSHNSLGSGFCPTGHLMHCPGSEVAEMDWQPRGSVSVVALKVDDEKTCCQVSRVREISKP